MAVFTYQGRNRRGELQQGTLDADTADHVARQLINTGVTPVNIKEVGNESATGQDAGKLLAKLFKPRVKLDELIMLCRQMRTLLRAGIPILRGLAGLAGSVRNPTLAQALFDVRDQLEAGKELNAALAQHPDIFMPLFIALVRIGESTGELDAAFAKLAEYLETEKKTRERIKSATRYPSIVIGAIVVAMVVINIWVIPVFAGVFARYDAELPIMTNILLTSSNFMLAWWPWLLTALIAAVSSYRVWVKTEQGKYLHDRQLLRLPIIGLILEKATLGRFAQSLALVMKAGVPLVQGLTVVAGVVNNAYVAERVLSMRDGIEKGDTIARTAATTGLFTPLVLQMIAVGEETGAIDELLLETAVHYESEVQYDLDSLSSAIEPIVIVILGVMVTVLALGVFLPMWNLAGVVG